LDEIPEPMVIALLLAGRGRYPEMIARSLRPLNSSETTADVAQRDEELARIRNVDGDSSADAPDRVVYRCRTSVVCGGVET
jgi:hypothetical protein